MGQGKNDDKQITILNKCLEWRRDGQHYEPDPRHAEIIAREMGVASSASVVTAGVKMFAVPEEDDPLLGPSGATIFRRIVARANFLSEDRMDIQTAVKEAARNIALPRQYHMDKLLIVAKYLVGHMRYVTKFSRREQVHAINSFGDLDFAGEVETRKRTSGGTLMLGDHPIKKWSSMLSTRQLPVV